MGDTATLTQALTAYEKLAKKHDPSRPRGIVVPARGSLALPEECAFCYAPARGNLALQHVGTTKHVVSKETRVTSFEVPVCRACHVAEAVKVIGIVLAVGGAIVLSGSMKNGAPHVAIGPIISVLGVALVLLGLALSKRRKNDVSLFVPGHGAQRSADAYLRFTDLRWGELVARLNDTKTVRLTEAALG